MKVDNYRMMYPAGTVIELTAPIEDKYSPKPIGSRLRVDYIDDAGGIHGSWLEPQKGSIAVIIGEDSFKIVS